MVLIIQVMIGVCVVASVYLIAWSAAEKARELVSFYAAKRRIAEMLDEERLRKARILLHDASPASERPAAPSLSRVIRYR